MKRTEWGRVACWLIAAAAAVLFALPATAASAADPGDGPGGPILVVTSDSNPFSRYLAEILTAEG